MKKAGGSLWYIGLNQASVLNLNGGTTIFYVLSRGIYHIQCISPLHTLFKVIKGSGKGDQETHSMFGSQPNYRINICLFFLLYLVSLLMRRINPILFQLWRSMKRLCLLAARYVTCTQRIESANQRSVLLGREVRRYVGREWVFIKSGRPKIKSWG